MIESDESLYFQPCFSPVWDTAYAAYALGECGHAPTERLAKAADTNPLTEREREVLQLVARGKTYKERGVMLTISPKTAENHVRNILEKLHLHSRVEAAVYAHRQHLLPTDD